MEYNSGSNRVSDFKFRVRLSLNLNSLKSELVMTDFCICRAIVSLLSPTSSFKSFSDIS